MRRWVTIIVIIFFFSQLIGGYSAARTFLEGHLDKTEITEQDVERLAFLVKKESLSDSEIAEYVGLIERDGGEINCDDGKFSVTALSSKFMNMRSEIMAKQGEMSIKGVCLGVDIDAARNQRDKRN